MDRLSYILYFDLFIYSIFKHTNIFKEPRNIHIHIRIRVESKY